MGLKERIIALFNPYCATGLRVRAAKLPNVPYKVLLELTATQIENGSISEDLGRLAVGYFRSGNVEMLKEGVRLLKLSHEQTTETLALLQTGVIKDWKDLE